MESKQILKESSHEIPSHKFMVNYKEPDVVRVIKELVNDTEEFTCNKIAAVGDTQFYNVEITCELGSEYQDIEASRFLIAQKIHKFKADFLSDLSEFLPVVNISLGNYEFTKNSDTLKFSLVLLMSQTNQRNWVNGEIKKTDKKSLESYLKNLDESLNKGLTDIFEPKKKVIKENLTVDIYPGMELKMGGALIKVDKVVGEKAMTTVNQNGTSSQQPFLVSSLSRGIQANKITILN